MKNKIKTIALLLVMIASALVPTMRVHALTTDRYVSPTGVNTGSCTASVPCKTFVYAMKQSKPGDTIHALPGTYARETLLSVGGAQDAAITLSGDGASSLGFAFDRVNWVVIEGFQFSGVDVLDFKNKSNYVTVRNNVVQFDHTGLYVRGYSSHILVEGNEFYQTCTLGKTWTQVKGSTCEGGAFYGSSYGGGSYYIRNNYVHDVFNAFLFTDSSTGQWMNSNVFISGNQITNVMDDAFEPEGDSFNMHFYNNTLNESHRIASFTTAALGPVFVYGNYQRVDGNPTNESSRYNSMLKLDLSKGYTNGIWVFNNTVYSLSGNKFYPLDMLSTTVKNITMENNIFNTSNQVVNQKPSFSTNALFNYNISRSAFGYAEASGLQVDPVLNNDGTLGLNSPAISRSSEIAVTNYFTGMPVIPTGSNAGAFINYSTPVWVMPPGGYPSTVPQNISGWPLGGTSTTLRVQETSMLVQETATPTSTVTATAAALTTSASLTTLETATPVPTTATPVETLATTSTPEATQTVESATATPTSTPTESATPIATDTPSPTPTVQP